MQPSPRPRSAPTGSRALIRAINRSAVLNTVRTHGAQSSAGLAKLSGLAPATISEITSSLLTEGWLSTEGHARVGAKGGRPGTILGLNPLGRLALGVKVLDDAAELVLVGLTGQVVLGERCPLPEPATQGLEAWLDALASAIIGLLDRAPAPVLGVGVGLTGQVDEHAVLTGSRLFPGQDRVEVGALLARRLPVPVHVENDVTTLVAAEQWFGAGQGERDFVVVTVGRGIGAGLVVAGRLHRGVGGAAGELGHVVIDPDGPRCDCGRLGCLEAFAADPAIALQAAALGLPADDPHLLQKSGELIGRAVAGLVTLIAPALVILTGEGLPRDGVRVQAITRAIEDHCFPPLRGRVRVLHEPMEFSTWATGAACLVLGRVFAAPTDGEVGRSPRGHSPEPEDVPALAAPH